jgi:hypothetical protein
MGKVQINIVYSPQKEPQHKTFENNRGIIWHSNKRDPEKHNVGMGWYSIRKPKKGDSIMVMEPYCILPRDYRVDFVKKFRYIFTWCDAAFKNKHLHDKVIKVNHPSCKDLYYNENMTKDWLPWSERKNEVAIIANNKASGHHSELYSLRIQLADLFNKKSRHDVSWYGQIPLKGKEYYKGSRESKKSILTKVKFSICTENSYDPIYTKNYFTEKMPQVWGSGCVPIYMGCHNIDSFGFNKKSYIDLRDYVTKKGRNLSIAKGRLLNVVDNYSKQHYNDFHKALTEEILIPEKLFNIISYERVYNKMIDAFSK